MAKPIYPRALEDADQAYTDGYVAGVAAVRRRMDEAASRLSDAAAYQIARMAGSVHECEVEGCRITQEEHHRLAYGIMAENRELKRRLQALENGSQTERR